MTTSQTRNPLGLQAYGVLTHLLSPAARFILNDRRRRGKEDPHRLTERLGHASKPRPDGPLIWIHAASVGEALSALPLIDTLLSKYADMHTLMTTGTVTSAALMENRLPDRAIHQFVPIDQPGAVRKFLDHWQPQAALWVEQDLWPNTIREASRRGIDLALINARMSDSSFRSWQRVPQSASALLSSFRICLAQDENAASKYRQLGAPNIQVVGNLKFAAAPLPYCASDFDKLNRDLKNRPIFLAASTHPSEEEKIGAAARLVKASIPDLLTIVIPRHPERGAEVQESLTQMGFTVARRAAGDSFDQAEVYVADTLGEMGLFYRLAEIVFIGGSLVEHGGQNPLEAARLNSCIVHGPHTHNFPEIYPEMKKRGASIEVASVEDLAERVIHLADNDQDRERARLAAKEYASAQDGILDATIDALEPILASLNPHENKVHAPS